mmetsp:Transcript_13448/g.34463  ORF Transcript_13448/g.34463 Transcript_13448/m.34463 type:complete len:239 (+) Transcript_13448:1129-1845(+)
MRAASLTAASIARTSSSLVEMVNCFAASMKHGHGVEMSPIRVASPKSWYGLVVKVSQRKASVEPSLTLSSRPWIPPLTGNDSFAGSHPRSIASTVAIKCDPEVSRDTPNLPSSRSAMLLIFPACSDLSPAAETAQHSGEPTYVPSSRMSDPFTMFSTRPSVNATHTSTSSFSTLAIMAPVPQASSINSTSTPCFSKMPRSFAMCHGILKCSGTPHTRILVPETFCRFGADAAPSSSLR